MTNTDAKNEFTVKEIVNVDRDEIVNRVKQASQESQGYATVIINGSLSSLDNEQRVMAERKIRDVARQVENDMVAVSQPVNANALATRLDALAVDGEGTVRILGQGENDGDNVDSRRLHDCKSSSANGPREDVTPAETDKFAGRLATAEAAYTQLEKLGGRPVCSLEQWRKIVANPETYPPHDFLVPWIHPRYSTDTRDDNFLSDMDAFSRQVIRWFAFLRWQWIFRQSPHNNPNAQNEVSGAEKSDSDPFELFLLFKIDSYVRSGDIVVTQQTSFREDIRNVWKSLPDPRTIVPRTNAEYVCVGAEADTETLTENTFSAYLKQTSDRLVPYCFHRPLELDTDPRKQSALSTWLEYLSFEVAFLKEINAACEQQESQYNEAWDKITVAARELRPTRRVPAGRNTTTSWNAIVDFLQETAPYRYLEKLKQEQQPRIQWIVNEARSMELELDEKEGTMAVSNLLIDKRKTGVGHLPDQATRTRSSRTWNTLTSLYSKAFGDGGKRV